MTLFAFMAFKLKKRIHDILHMDSETYAKFFKKESQRATAFGDLDLVVCTQHQFADGKMGSLVLMGALVGDLANFYKQNKTTPTFGKGKCRFDAQARTTVFNLSLDSGRAKPDQLIKAGRRLWAKAALTPQIHKGGLPSTSAPTTTPIRINWQQLERQYLTVKKTVQLQVVVPLKTNHDTPIDPQQLQLVKQALKAAQNWLKAYQKAPTSVQQTQQPTYQQFTQEYQQLQRLALQLQQRLNA